MYCLEGDRERDLDCLDCGLDPLDRGRSSDSTGGLGNANSRPANTLSKGVNSCGVETISALS